MGKVESNLGFRLMALTYKFRDFLRPRHHILQELGLKPGDHVLDYGCGPGSYILPLAELVGKEGRVYALDLHPLAIQRVREISARKQLPNVRPVLSNCKTGLPDEGIDAVLLYDVLHDLDNPDEVLEELHRVLKPRGILSVSDHHMKGEAIEAKVTKRGLFSLSKKGERTYNFLKMV